MYLLHIALFQQPDLNSNIEIHKLIGQATKGTSIINLNSNIEIHK